MIGKVAKDLTKEGEKKAPIKSLKIKVKFDKAEGKKKEMAEKMHPKGCKCGRHESN